MPIIDIHAHGFSDKIVEKAVAQLHDHYQLTITGSGTIKDLLWHASTAGVDIAVVHAAATTPLQVEPANKWVSGIAAVNPMLMAFGTMHPDYPRIEEELMNLKALGLAGLKLHADFQGFDVDSPGAMRIFKTAEELGLIVMCHCGDRNLDHSSPHRIARVVRAFPGLRIVVAHMGGVFEWEEARRVIIPLLKDHPGVHTDTSSSLWLMDRDIALQQIELFGTDRILFGTDYPIRGHKEELAFIRGLFDHAGLSKAEREAILGGNAANLLGIESLEAEGATNAVSL